MILPIIIWFIAAIWIVLFTSFGSKNDELPRKIFYDEL